MSLSARISLLAAAIAAEFNTIRTEMGDGGGASVATDDTAPTGSETLWYQPSTGILSLLVDGQWVISSKDGIDGLDGADGADGTMPDGSVTYAKLATALKSASSVTDGVWDFAASGIINAAISSNVTVTFPNLQQNTTLKVKIVVTNSATIAFPAYAEKLKGFTDPSGTDGTYLAWFDCWDDGSGTEKVYMSITQTEV